MVRISEVKKRIRHSALWESNTVFTAVIKVLRADNIANHTFGMSLRSRSCAMGARASYPTYLKNTLLTSWQLPHKKDIVLSRIPRMWQITIVLQDLSET